MVGSPRRNREWHVLRWIRGHYPPILATEGNLLAIGAQLSLATMRVMILDSQLAGWSRGSTPRTGIWPSPRLAACCSQYRFLSRPKRTEIPSRSTRRPNRDDKRAAVTERSDLRAPRIPRTKCALPRNLRPPTQRTVRASASVRAPSTTARSMPTEAHGVSLVRPAHSTGPRAQLRWSRSWLRAGRRRADEPPGQRAFRSCSVAPLPRRTAAR